MSLNRNKDCGIISSYSRVVKISDSEADERLHLLLQEYAKLVTLRTHPHTFKEIEQYFLEQCDALPIPLNDDDIKKHNQRFVTYINAMVQMGYWSKLY